MLVANSFDLWQKDTFFSAAEEVQQSADIMESAYRTWIKARREGLMPQHLDEERELQMALGTAKWQLEEFEKAVRSSYRRHGDDVTISRHNQFISTMEDQISRVETELKESFNAEGKKPFRWVNLDDEECDDFALFLSGTSQRITDECVTNSFNNKNNNNNNNNTKQDSNLCSESSSKIETSNQAKSLEEYPTSNEGVKEESRFQETGDKVAGNRRMWSPPNKSALEIVIVGGNEQKNAPTEAFPKEKGSKGAKGGAINHTQLKMINWINQRLRGGHRRQRQQLVSTVRPVNSMRFVLVLMLTIFLVGGGQQQQQPKISPRAAAAPAREAHAPPLPPELPPPLKLLISVSPFSSISTCLTRFNKKLGELGYQRNAKKCKEKFENVQKYYKRTKESRGGRHDGKSYKFFNQLEALNTTTPDNNLLHHHHLLPVITPAPPPQPPEPSAPATTPPPLFSTVGVSFSSPSSSSSSDAEQEDDDDEIETELGDDINPIRRRKRKRSSGSIDEKMMEFFEGLLKQAMQKQETMQQRFLQAIEKRENDRMIREEAWKRQDMARLAREHDLMSHDCSISASRDAAIITFLEKITGQKIHLPHTPPPPPPPPPPTSMQHHHRQQSFTTPEIIETHHHRRNLSTSTSREIVAASVMPEKQQIQQPHEFTTGMEIAVAATSSSSSRWPKAEVLALIQLRSGMEHRYQETGLPKGPLWEEISAGMKRMGYNRNPKRCKEKWENINKYFKKVKESDKKRPEDTKTCPYFHELDELYRKKVLGNTSSSIVISSLFAQERHQVQDVGMMSSSVQSLQGNKAEDKDGGKNELQAIGTIGASPSNLFDEQTQDNIGGSKQPEAMLKKQHDQQGRGIIMMENRSKHIINGSNGDDLDRDENDDEDSYEDMDEDEEYDAKTEEEMKTVYKLQFQRQNNVSSSDGTGGTASSSSFMAMVQ